MTSWLRRRGAHKDFYVRELIERAVEDMEDYYLAADGLERIRQGTEEVYSVEEVSRSLGLDDSMTSASRALRVCQLPPDVSQQRLDERQSTLPIDRIRTGFDSLIAKLDRVWRVIDQLPETT